MLNIFDKDVDELVPVDLLRLKDVAEGWYVEYKQQFVDSAKCAKSISAFANSYGGWLFYGIKSSNRERLADEFCGIPIEDVALVEQRLRQAASTNINPPPYYLHTVLKGPCPEIGLGDNRAVVAVWVPLGQEAPYVHSSGRIYRRIGDESSPVEETEKYQLEQLFERSQKRITQFRNIVGSQTGEDISSPKLRLVLFDNLHKEPGLVPLSFPVFKKIMRREDLPFDTLFPTSDGYFAMQAKNNDPTGPMLTWRYRLVGVHEITLPLTFFQIDSSPVTSLMMSGYIHGEDFIASCLSRGIRAATGIDLSLIKIVLEAVCRTYSLLVSEAGMDKSLHCKLNVQGLAGKVPFIDLSSYIDHIANEGLPVIQDDWILMPSGDDLENVYRLINHRIQSQLPSNWRAEEHTSDDDMRLASRINATILFVGLCHSMGIPPEATKILDMNTPDIEQEFVALADRYKQNQRIRK